MKDKTIKIIVLIKNEPGGETDSRFRSLNLSQRLVPAHFFKHSEQNLRATDPDCSRQELKKYVRISGKT